jgi:hypothetical protein
MKAYYEGAYETGREIAASSVYLAEQECEQSRENRNAFLSSEKLKKLAATGLLALSLAGMMTGCGVRNTQEMTVESNGTQRLTEEEIAALTPQSFDDYPEDEYLPDQVDKYEGVEQILGTLNLNRLSDRELELYNMPYQEWGGVSTEDQAIFVNMFEDAYDRAWYTRQETDNPMREAPEPFHISDFASATPEDLAKRNLYMEAICSRMSRDQSNNFSIDLYIKLCLSTSCGNYNDSLPRQVADEKAEKYVNQEKPFTADAGSCEVVEDGIYNPETQRWEGIVLNKQAENGTPFLAYLTAYEVKHTDPSTGEQETAVFFELERPSEYI